MARSTLLFPLQYMSRLSLSWTLLSVNFMTVPQNFRCLARFNYISIYIVTEFKTVYHNRRRAINNIFAMTLYSFTNSQFIMFLILTFHVVVITLAHSSAMLCHDHERSALLHFKRSMSINKSASSDFLVYSKTESWKVSGGSSADCCSWVGVECDDHTGYVIGLHLSSSLLSGTLHHNSTLFNLVHLHTLNLADNHFRNSSIPAQISHLSSLSRLDLSYSAFSGQIPPGLSRLSKLTLLDLSGNYLYGVFPVDIFHLPDMLVLNVSDNPNLSGFLPEFNQTASFRELELGRTNFSGKLPVSIGNLQSLTKLRIRDCYFSGSIPASVANLTQLTYLSLSENMFNESDKLSWLAKLTKLNILGLHNINLYGDIPLWVMNMTHLVILDLGQNKLTGPIPGSFSLLVNLEVVELSRNNFTGVVDADIFLSLRKLTFLSLSFNKITLHTHHHINSTYPNLQSLQLNSCNLRRIPYFLKFQNNLEILFLGNNNIHGTIPHWIWNVSDHLEAIDLSDNFFTSMEHNSTAILSKSLNMIDISRNMLQGNLPVPPPNTILYIVSNNSLSGNIPPMICGALSLKILDLSHNNLSGPIPPNLSSSLTSLILQGNNFSGTIPQIYTKECELKEMDLSQNQLNGKVPKLLSNCKMLQILDLSDNQLEQTFPNWLGSLPQLQVLLLHSNKFHGAIGSPKSPSDFQMLRIVDLSHNSFTGDLPVEYLQVWVAMKIYRQDMELYMQTDFKFESQHWPLKSSYAAGSITLTNKGSEREYEKILNIFSAIDLSSNKFIGQIPDSIGSLEGLQLLSLSNNELTGPIPQSITNLTQLESLDLSHNKLSGVIPQQLASQLTFLAFFNVSYNHLSGPIPHGRQFETFNKENFIGNSGLCGLPLSEKCGTPHSQPADDGEDDTNGIDEFPSNFDWIFILAGLGSGLIVGFVMGNILTNRYWWFMVRIVQSIGRRQ